MKTQKMIAISMLLVLGLLCSGAFATSIIWKTDWGTTAQQDAWTGVGKNQYETWTYPWERAVVWDGSGSILPGADIDSDGLAGTASLAGSIGGGTPYFEGKEEINLNANTLAAANGLAAPGTGQYYVMNNLSITTVILHSGNNQVGIQWSDDGGATLESDMSHGSGNEPASAETFTMDNYTDVTDLKLMVVMLIQYDHVGWGNPGMQNIPLSGDLTLVPEPATLAVLGLAGIGFLLRRRRH